MKNWSIRQQLVLLALLPVVLTAVSLSVYFTVSQVQQISENLYDHARSTASQIASSAEYALYSGNTYELERSLGQVLADRDIVNIRIADKTGNTIVELSDEIEPVSDSLLDPLLDNENITVQQPVISRNLPLADYDDSSSAAADDSQWIGTVYLTINNHYSNIKKSETIIKGALISLAMLALSIYVALRISRQIARPVQQLTSAVKNIASGDLSTHLDLDAPAELGVLEACVNQMVDELRIAQSGMESRISEFTRELQETLVELEERNAELDIARSNAIQASKAKSEFLANMSHEIRTPLSGIIGFAELLENTNLDSHQQEYATIITESSRSLLTIIEEILDLSKIESGKLDIYKDDCDLVAIVENIITLLTPGAQAKSIELFYDLHEATPSMIISDSLRVQQILTNLIGNAVKFTDKGYVYVHIETSPFDPEFIKIVVADTGIGLDANDKSNLFKAFTQADTSITRRFGGTGLGLVISRKLTQLLGGEIGFDSTPGEGSTFWITLPAAVSPNISEQYRPPLDCNIGLVDENYLTRKACKSMLYRWGCRITEFSHRDILDRSSADDNIDVYLISLTLEDMQQDIDALVAAIQTTDKDKPVIVLCSSHKESDILKLKQTGVRAVLPRTTHRDKIRQTLELILEQPQHIPGSLEQPHEAEADAIDKDLRILIVDDNETNLKLASIILSKSGLDITTTKSGRHAIELLTANHFDVVFMDLHMPDLDGYQSAQQIRELGNNIHQPYIVALTANAMPQEIKKTGAYGIDDVLIKPISEHQVTSLLKQWQQNRKTREQQASQKNSEHNHVEVFSKAEALSMSAGNIELAQEMLDMLIRELPQRQQAITEAMENQDVDSLKHHVHTLHGATRYCATPALRSVVSDFETAINSGEQSQFDSHLLKVNTEIHRLLELNTGKLFQ